MKILQFEGDLLTSTAECILHQVNCAGKMNSGVAKAIREKWPIVFEKYKQTCENPTFGLGTVLPVKVNETQTILNLFAQDSYGYDGKLYTSYDAVNTCLNKIADYCVKNNIKTIALPYMMSCCRGGGNWTIIMELIKDNFKDTDVDIEIWKL